MLPLLPDSLQGTRNRAILLVGFVGACRSSELVALDISDLKPQAEGLLVTLRRSKADQEGGGRYVAIPYELRGDTCPVRGAGAPSPYQKSSHRP
jgi:integrase